MRVFSLRAYGSRLGARKHDTARTSSHAFGRQVWVATSSESPQASQHRGGQDHGEAGHGDESAAQPERAVEHSPSACVGLLEHHRQLLWKARGTWRVERLFDLSHKV